MPWKKTLNPFLSPCRLPSWGQSITAKHLRKPFPGTSGLQSPQRAWAWWPEDKGWPQAHRGWGSSSQVHHTPGHGGGGRGLTSDPRTGTEQAGQRVPPAAVRAPHQPGSQLPCRSWHGSLGAPLTGPLPGADGVQATKSGWLGGRGSPEWVFSSICGGFPVFLSRSVNSGVPEKERPMLPGPLNTQPLPETRATFPRR